MSDTRRVVVTGLGLITPIGQGRAAFAESLQAGRSGCRPLTGFDPADLPVRIAAEVHDFDARNYLDKKERKRLNAMVRTMQFAVAAAAQAAGEARLREAPPDSARYGTVLGSAVIPAAEDLGLAAWETTGGKPGPVDPVAWGERGIPNVPPMWLLNCIPNVMTAHVSILQGAQGPSNTITLSDAAGLFALAEGQRVIVRDQADVMLVGAGDTQVLPLQFARHLLLSPLSRRTEADRACRPFDRWRDGTVAGEGGVAFVLEESEHARKRGVTAWAEVLGTGAAFDRRRDGQGLVRAMRTALEHAGVSADEVDHVNAHGLATVEADRLEARAIREVFGPRGVPVFAAKGYLGNMGAAASLTELSGSILALHDGTLPPTRNHDETDPDCPVIVVRQPRPVELPIVLKVSFTSMGQCIAAVLRVPPLAA